MRFLGAALLLALAAVSCAESSGARSGRPTVAGTVAPVTDIVRQVVGDDVDLVRLIPEGVDSHTFEASPSTVKTLSRSDVLFAVGLHLEGSILRQARANMPRRSQIVALGEATITRRAWAYDFTFPRSKGDPNPHLWMDPTYAKSFARIVRDTMRTRDRRHLHDYERNYERFAAVIDRLDRAIKASIDSIPHAHRKLLTYHDSFAYFSRRYGIPVVGAVQPNDFAEPSPRELQTLIEQVRDSGVPAIFGSEVFPSTVLAQVAREAGARYVTKLRDDELPRDAHTYIGMMVEDTTEITRALGGDPSPLAGVPTKDTWKP